MKFISKIITLIYFFAVAFSAHAEDIDFLNTVDGESFSVIDGVGTERGLYFQADVEVQGVSLIYTDDLEESDNEVVEQNQPEIKFLSNTAKCEIFQGPYFSTSSLAIKSVVTYAYLISVKASVPNTSCIIEVYSDDTKEPIRVLQYFTLSEEK